MGIGILVIVDIVQVVIMQAKSELLGLRLDKEKKLGRML